MHSNIILREIITGFQHPIRKCDVNKSFFSLEAVSPQMGFGVGHGSDVVLLHQRSSTPLMTSDVIWVQITERK